MENQVNVSGQKKTVKSNFSQLVDTSIQEMRSHIDADTVIGNPIETPTGVIIYPISRISVGYASGGIDLPQKTDEAGKRKNFGGGVGSGVTVVPVGFLTVSPEGLVNVIPMTGVENSMLDYVNLFMAKAPDLVEKAKTVLSGVGLIKNDTLAEKKAIEEKPKKQIVAYGTV